MALGLCLHADALRWVRVAHLFPMLVTILEACFLAATAGGVCVAKSDFWSGAGKILPTPAKLR